MSNWDLLNAGSYSNFTNSLGTISQGVQLGSSYLGRAADLLDSAVNIGISSADHVRDINTNGFLSSNTIFKPNYFARAFDEPTYLTFKIEFCFDDMDRNAMYTNALLDQQRSAEIRNNKALYDYLPEPFFQDGILCKEDNALDTASLFNNLLPGAGATPIEGVGINAVYSTEDYLGYSLGDYGRAQLMRKIKLALKDIQENFPYYFRSVEGLESINKIDPKTGKRIADDAVITIKCYEGLDLKITQLLQMIRKVMWDDMYQRWVLPDMMRYFSMKIYVSEIRTFHELHSNPLVGTAPRLKRYDFIDADTRNAKVFPPKGDILATVFNFTGDILTAADAIMGRFLPNNESFNADMQGLTSSVSNISDAYSSIMNMYQMMCVSAINDVMPTICFDLHMCEFDISDTFSEMSTLNSTSSDPQEQSIRIKAKWVEDYQVYPLDINLKPSDKYKSRYNIDSRMYDTYANKQEQNSYYSKLRRKGWTGSTIFADKAFDKENNDKLRSYYNMADDAGLQVHQKSLYRNMSNEYHDELKNVFAKMNILINYDKNEESPTLRGKMYSEAARAALKNETSDGTSSKRPGNLRYKKNSLSPATNVLSLIYSGLNGWMNGNIPSKATSISYETLQEELPDVYAAAQTLRNYYAQLHESGLEDENIVGYRVLESLAFSRATRYTALGNIAQNIVNTAVAQQNNNVG